MGRKCHLPQFFYIMDKREPKVKGMRELKNLECSISPVKGQCRRGDYGSKNEFSFPPEVHYGFGLLGLVVGLLWPSFWGFFLGLWWVFFCWVFGGVSFAGCLVGFLCILCGALRCSLV